MQNDCSSTDHNVGRRKCWLLDLSLTPCLMGQEALYHLASRWWYCFRHLWHVSGPHRVHRKGLPRDAFAGASCERDEQQSHCDNLSEIIIFIVVATFFLNLFSKNFKVVHDPPFDPHISPGKEVRLKKCELSKVTQWALGMSWDLNPGLHISNSILRFLKHTGIRFKKIFCLVQ